MSAFTTPGARPANRMPPERGSAKSSEDLRVVRAIGAIAVRLHADIARSEWSPLLCPFFHMLGDCTSLSGISTRVLTSLCVLMRDVSSLVDADAGYACFVLRARVARPPGTTP